MKRRSIGWVMRSGLGRAGEFFGDLYPEEALEEIQKAYDDALILRRSIHPDDVLEEMALGKLRVRRRLERRIALIGDAEKDTGWDVRPATSDRGATAVSVV